MNMRFICLVLTAVAMASASVSAIVVLPGYAPWQANNDDHSNRKSLGALNLPFSQLAAESGLTNAPIPWAFLLDADPESAPCHDE